MGNHPKSKKSLCEKSAMLAINIIKLPSFYLAKMSLGRRPPSSSGTNRNAKVPKDKEIDIVQCSFLVGSIDDDAQYGRINKEATLKLANPALSIDDRATAYIKKFRQRNSFDLASHRHRHDDQGS